MQIAQCIHQVLITALLFTLLPFSQCHLCHQTWVNQPFFLPLTCKKTRPWQQNYFNSKSVLNRLKVRVWVFSLWKMCLHLNGFRHLLSGPGSLCCCVYIFCSDQLHGPRLQRTALCIDGCQKRHFYKVETKWPLLYNWTVRKIFLCHSYLIKFIKKYTLILGL